MTDERGRGLMTGLARCRGCGVRFAVKAGCAGQYCTRACYENPERPNRRRRTRAAQKPRAKDGETPPASP